MVRRELGPMFDGATPREQRLAAAGRMAAGLMHDFRNQLGPIANLAFMLEQRADDPDAVRNLARRLAELAQPRGRVMDRLRDFVRQDAARFPDGCVVDLSAAARETVALCTTLAASRPEQRALCLACDAPQPVLVPGDAGDVRTAIFELVLNAMEASPHGATIRVGVRVDGERAVVEVRDSGPGLPEGMAEHVFDPFISDHEAPDAGLGLSAAWGIARRHGGDLSLGTAVSGGGIAVLSLPRTAVAT